MVDEITRQLRDGHTARVEELLQREVVAKGIQPGDYGLLRALVEQSDHCVLVTLILPRRLLDALAGRNVPVLALCEEHPHVSTRIDGTQREPLPFGIAESDRRAQATTLADLHRRKLYQPSSGG